MRRTHLFWALILLLPTLAQAAITVSPARLEKAVSPEDDSLDFVISNPSKVAVEITLSTGPIAHDRSGGSIPGKATDPYDVSGRIHFDRTSFTLPARRWRRIHARVDVPSRPGGGHAFIYVRGIDVGQPKGGTVNALRVGMVVELTFPDPGKAAVAVEGLVAHQGELFVAVRNEGQRRVAPEGTVTLTGPSGEKRSASLVAANIFPGLVRELKLAGLPASLPEGSYSVQVAVSAPVEAHLSTGLAVKDGKLTPASGLAVLGQR